MNPKTKKGDKVLILQIRNDGSKVIENQVVTVIRGSNGGTLGQITVQKSDGKQRVLYNTSPTDEYVLASRKDVIEHLKTKIADYHKEIATMVTQLEFLQQYKDKDDYIADKVMKLMESSGKDRETVRKIVKEIRSSEAIFDNID